MVHMCADVPFSAFSLQHVYTSYICDIWVRDKSMHRIYSFHLTWPIKTTHQTFGIRYGTPKLDNVLLGYLNLVGHSYTNKINNHEIIISVPEFFVCTQVLTNIPRGDGRMCDIKSCLCILRLWLSSIISALNFSNVFHTINIYATSCDSMINVPLAHDGLFVRRMRGTTLSLRKEKWCICGPDLSWACFRCVKEKMNRFQYQTLSSIFKSSKDLSDNEIGTDGLDKLFQARIFALQSGQKEQTMKKIEKEKAVSAALHLQVLRDHRVPCVVLKAYRNSVDETFLQMKQQLTSLNFKTQILAKHQSMYVDRSLWWSLKTPYF